MFELFNFAGCFARGPLLVELRRHARVVASLLLILVISVASSSLARASGDGASASVDALQLAYLLDSTVAVESSSARTAAPSSQSVTLADALADLAWRQATSRKLQAASRATEPSLLSF